MRTSYYSTEAGCLQVEGTVRTPGLKGPGGAGPMRYDPGPHVYVAYLPIW